MSINTKKTFVLFSGKPEEMIWKIKLDDATQTLAWENRTLDKKVSFYAYNFSTQTHLLQNFKFEEDWLLGLDFVNAGIAYFHGFENEFSPVHKGIIALDLKENKILWQNFSVSVQQFTKEGVVVFDAKIFPRAFQLLHYKNGELISKLQLKDLYQTQSISNQIFLPELIASTEIWDTQHQLIYHDLKIISVYKNEADKTNQYLQVYKNEDLIFEDLLNADIQKLSIDTFFVWLGKLVYIKNKSEIVSYLV
ncbi:DUF4905 domain-containing protein [Pedobacter cryophilus]|uniref:DUF4905 domain-containing protein n=1 Tax=Pedobacter cryophilus TaxID=2571271 RepID=A0A4U1BTT8_9SPHI|nr:DUF4905 domain-containing protein [Pedobacter cryophilus]TKB96019.1 DUF4905 domain-containing protein [Pedobacter cryophilus]